MPKAAKSMTNSWGRAAVSSWFWRWKWVCSFFGSLYLSWSGSFSLVLCALSTAHEMLFSIQSNKLFNVYTVGLWCHKVIIYETCLIEWVMLVWLLHLWQPTRKRCARLLLNNLMKVWAPKRCYEWIGLIASVADSVWVLENYWNDERIITIASGSFSFDRLIDKLIVTALGNIQNTVFDCFFGH